MSPFSTNTGDVLAMNVAFPPKVAVMLCGPPQKATLALPILKVAV